MDDDSSTRQLVTSIRRRTSKAEELAAKITGGAGSGFAASPLQPRNLASPTGVNVDLYGPDCGGVGRARWKKAQNNANNASNNNNPTAQRFCTSLGGEEEQRHQQPGRSLFDDNDEEKIGSEAVKGKIDDEEREDKEAKNESSDESSSSDADDLFAKERRRRALLCVIDEDETATFSGNSMWGGSTCGGDTTWSDAWAAYHACGKEELNNFVTFGRDGASDAERACSMETLPGLEKAAGAWEGVSSAFMDVIHACFISQEDLDRVVDAAQCCGSGSGQATGEEATKA